MTMKPPPPGPATNGIVTPSALAVATAASTALPPLRSAAMPALLASKSIEATAPPVPVATAVLRSGAGRGVLARRPGRASAAAGTSRAAAISAVRTETGVGRRMHNSFTGTWTAYPLPGFTTPRV